MIFFCRRFYVKQFTGMADFAPSRMPFRIRPWLNFSNALLHFNHSWLLLKARFKEAKGEKPLKILLEFCISKQIVYKPISVSPTQGWYFPPTANDA